jgi:putative tryptophan/tyrosine transport system substrate-binding protein
VDRRRFLLTSLAGALGAPIAAESQQTTKQWRVGYLSAGFPDALGLGTWEVLRTALSDHGYAEGQNITLHPRFAEGQLERVPRLAADVVALKPDVVVVTGTAETQAVKSVTAAIPVVMVVVPDPVGSGLVSSLGRPGGNVTGLTSTPGLEIQGKRLELLRAMVPRANDIAFLVNPTVPATARRVEGMKAAARTLNLRMRIIEAHTSEQLRSAFATMRQLRIEAILIPTDPLFLSHRRQIAELATEGRLPAMCDVREYADVGGLAAYGPVFSELFRRAAVYVDKILKGARPGDLPVEQPTKFELVINLKTAKALNVTIPPSLLVRADQVIE